MKVGIICLQHETNTFLSRMTGIEQFEENMLLDGPDMAPIMSQHLHEVGGFFRGLQSARIEAVGLLAARALPYGMIKRSALDALCERIRAALQAAPPLDGLLLAPHGAAAAEHAPDADGFWMQQVRDIVGPEMPLIATADPHGNWSPAMHQAVNAVISYRTNPHVDQVERGLEAAALMARTLRGEVRPVMASAWPPMLMSIDRQCTEESPCLEFGKRMDEVRALPGILSASLFLGFPYADVPEMGSSIVVVADGDPQLAARQADLLAQELWGQRQEFTCHLPSVAEAVKQAADAPGPVCLLDVGDNVGGGSPADGTILLQALADAGQKRAFVCLFDPESAEQAAAIGSGGIGSFSLGGKTDNLHGAPLEGRFEVHSLHDGVFEETEVRHGGIRQFNQGRTAILHGMGLTIMLTSLRTPPFSLQQMLHFGLQPESFQVIVAKGVNAPIAAYAPVCKTMIRVDTPGVCTANVDHLEFKHRRKPMFPFEPETPWNS
ncbi:M81 family metallopeptidase [Lignipirellula cremea]|uniref:Uncharacterized protein n=1 Tax=Lignipirellula cremea TaxID=2528010 RepID=A0A518DTG0_9BACT|nr:M81 family metallopeptidase [Lignipirellula cremea]QDU95129.1 hypothetical protein Pla8534_29410 [Lignipirellula cremea]